MARGIAANTAALAAARISGLLAAVAVTPILLSRLGAARFGTWSIISGLVALVSLADLGFSKTAVREVARTVEASDPTVAILALKLVRYWGLAIAGLLMVLTVATWPALADLVPRLGVGSSYRYCALFVLASFAVDAFAAPWRAVLEGKRRFSDVAAISTVVAVVIALGDAFAVILSKGLPGLGMVAVAGSSLQATLLRSRSLRHGAAFRSRFKGFPRHRLHPLLAYGTRVQVSNVASVVNNDTDRLVVGGIAGAATAGWFDLGSKLVNGLRLLPFLALSTTFPLAAQLVAEGKRDELTALYYKATHRLAVFSFTSGAVFIVCSRPLVELWLGRQIPFAAKTLTILVPGCTLAIVGGAATTLCWAEGRPGIPARYSVITAIANVAITVPAVIVVGPIGAPVGTSLAGTLGIVYLLARFHRDPDRPAALLWRAIGIPLLSSALAGVTMALAARQIHFSGRLSSAVTVLALGSGTVLVVAASLLILGLIEWLRGSSHLSLFQAVMSSATGSSPSSTGVPSDAVR